MGKSLSLFAQSPAQKIGQPIPLFARQVSNLPFGAAPDCGKNALRFAGPPASAKFENVKPDNI
jgi:hypothetical protein